VSPNGTGKSMILKNIAYHAIVRGQTVRFMRIPEALGH
jgi:DNA replication protein DnaC